MDIHHIDPVIVNRNCYDLRPLIYRVVTALILLWYDTLCFLYLYRRNPVLYVNVIEISTRQSLVP